MVSKDSSGAVIVFALGDHRFALNMSVVERVVRAVEVSPVSDAPPGVVGVINVHGRIIPVFDIRPRFGLASREIRVSDHLVIARAGADHTVAILVDTAVDVVSGNHTSVTLTMDSLAGAASVDGVLLQGDEFVPIQDLSRFLPADPGKNPPLKLAA